MKDHLTLPLIHHLYWYMLQADVAAAGVVKVTDDAFLISMAHVLKGSQEQKAKVISCLAAGGTTVAVTTEHMTKVVKIIFLIIKHKDCSLFYLMNFDILVLYVLTMEHFCAGFCKLRRENIL